MMKARLYVSGIIIGSSLALSGCEASTRCMNIPKDPDTSDAHFYNFPEWKERGAKLEILKGNVERCYSSRPFKNPKYKIIFSAAKIDPAGDTVLIYEFYGIEDLRAAFLLDKAGNISKVYTFSTAG